MVTDAERIARVVELATIDAKDRLGRELAAYNDYLALNKSLGNGRSWLGVADRLAAQGRNYVADLAAKIDAISTSCQASRAFSDAAEGFLAYLDAIYQELWTRGALWRMVSDSPAPSAWKEARQPLEMEIRLQQLALEDRADCKQNIKPEIARPEKPIGRRGRTKGSGSMAFADAPLLKQMSELIANGEAFSADGAAKIVAGKAKGGGTEASRAARLAKRYRAPKNKSA